MLRATGIRCLLLMIASMLLTACPSPSPEESEEPEGTNVGDCDDGADNDGDGSFDCNDPGCFGSPLCSGAGGGGTGGGGTGGGSTQDCNDLPQRTWAGLTPCYDIGSEGHSSSNELKTVWRTEPSIICAYSPFNTLNTPCGPTEAGNARYCAADNSIAWDGEMMNQLYGFIGDFAPEIVLAHEWGHRNQAALGLLVNGSNKALELHADCQAGVYAAVEEARGRTQPGDFQEAFAALCHFGDTYTSPWFAPGAHGTCPERVDAFNYGYQHATEALGGLCGSAPLPVMRSICG